MQSSPAEVTMQSQNRKRAPAWTDREVLDLIAVWGDESVLSELRSKRRNAEIYEKISKAMTERGYSRDATQCRVKIKELRQAYQKTKESNGRSGSQPQTCRFYEALHSILGAAATTTPPLTVDSEDGILSTAASSEMLADREDEEGEEEEEAVNSAYNADFPDSQDLFITLTEIPYQPSPGINPDPESGEGSVAAILPCHPPHRGWRRLGVERKGHGTTCSQNLWAAPEPSQHSRPSGGRTCRNTSEHTANGKRGGGRKTSRRLKRCLD
ncbi:myb/SANT-like DNA-binding domain-containing protein 2 [Chrysemys picta bellii]|uniref:myb/SANT-like DNA-binding domain-containing protein 2 n=1 Tax=Chrysemys picta bellii TaxID=8478 RepID=UPI0032B2B03B